MFLAGDVERGVQGMYEFFITVTDGVLSNVTKLVILITESNEFAPAFSTNDPSSIAFAEDTPTLTVIASFNVSDGDFDLSGEFDISVTNSDELFGVSQSNAYKFASIEVTLIQPFDFEVFCALIQLLINK